MYDLNLYPPIFSQSYMPAFVAYDNNYTNKQCRIYFQLSDLNIPEDLYHISAGSVTTYPLVQVTVRDQKTNKNALNSKYSNEIVLKQLQMQSDNRGYITIYSQDMKNGKFEVNNYYKVQIRFTSKDVAPPPPIETPFDQSSEFGSWLTDNIDCFSQWSTVVLIRGIGQPQLNYTINGSSQNNITLNTDYIKLQGELTFNMPSGIQNEEKLDKYQVLVWSNTGVVENSEEIYSQNNRIQYTIQKVLKVGQSYNINIEYSTSNLFEGISSKTITIGSITPMPANMKLREQVNNNAGYIKLILGRDVEYTKAHQDPAEVYNLYQFVYQNDNQVALGSHTSVSQQLTNRTTNDTIGYLKNAVFDGYYQRILFKDEYSKSFLTSNDMITLRRSSSKTDFSEWDILLEDYRLHTPNIVNLYWYDYSAEPGVWYRYQVIRNTRENGVWGRTATLVTPEDNPVMLDTDDIFLNSNGEQLIVKFDPSIANISSKVAESVTETIGSKYPFIRRNGNVNYKTFSLSGTISCFMDLENNMLKASKEDVFGDSANLYKQYNEEKCIDLYNDFIYEKFFRQKVIEFLQKNDVKLFRSLTEGNILIKLNNITFVPNQILGRLIYSFSCTAYEVAECNTKNYNKYNILVDNIEILTKADIDANEEGG